MIIHQDNITNDYRNSKRAAIALADDDGGCLTVRLHSVRHQSARHSSLSRSNSDSKRQFNPRSGLSLLEIILSIAIFGLAMIVITNMFFLGYRSALRARLLSDANILCDAKMAELASGVLPADSVSGQLIEEQKDWSYSVNVQPSLQPGLLVATVTVTQADPNAAIPLAVSIVRFLPDPDYEPDQ